jgi:quercetin dioxygenase-like cupin family protein
MTFGDVHAMLSQRDNAVEAKPVIRLMVLISALVLSSCGGSAAPTGPAATAAAPTVAATSSAAALLLTPANSVPQPFQWTKAPAAYPAGAEIVVMEGDTSKPGPFTLRLRFPDGYTVASHSHPVDEHVTVIQGTLLVGMGPTGKKETAVEMPTGSFFLMPSMTQHYVWAKGVTIVQSHGVGPTGLVYVNPADDPRKP